MVLLPWGCFGFSNAQRTRAHGMRGVGENVGSAAEYSAAVR